MRRLKNYLVYVDDANATLGVLDRIIEWAQASQARLTLAGVVEPIRSWITEAYAPAAELENERVSTLESRLDELVQALADSDLDIQVKVFQVT